MTVQAHAEGVCDLTDPSYVFGASYDFPPLVTISSIP